MSFRNWDGNRYSRLRSHNPDFSCRPRTGPPRRRYSAALFQLDDVVAMQLGANVQKEVVDLSLRSNLPKGNLAIRELDISTSRTSGCCLSR